MKEEKKKKKLSLFFLGILTFSIVFVLVAFYLEDENILNFLDNSSRMAVKSFHVLGLDGKEKNPRREKEKRDLENTTAEIVALKVKDEIVYYPEFAFYLLASKKELEMNYGKNVWRIVKEGKSLEENLMSEIGKELVQLKIIVSEARKTGLELSDMEREEILNTVEEQLKNIDPVLIAKYYLDRELLTKIYEENFLATKFHALYIKEKKKSGDFRAGAFIFRTAYEDWEKNYETELFLEQLTELTGSGT